MILSDQSIRGSTPAGIQCYLIKGADTLEFDILINLTVDDSKKGID